MFDLGVFLIDLICPLKLINNYNKIQLLVFLIKIYGFLTKINRKHLIVNVSIYFKAKIKNREP